MSDRRTTNFSQKGFTGNFLAMMKQFEKNMICFKDFLSAVFTRNTASVSFTGDGNFCDPLEANVNISHMVGNTLLIAPDGLYSAGGGSGTVKVPLTGIAGDGGASDPIVGTTSYTNVALVGLGVANGGRIMINVNGSPMLNYGVNSQFSFNPATGAITGLPSAWFANDSIYVDLNQ